MADNPEFGRRLRDARRDLAKATDHEPSFKEIGVEVAKREGRAEPFRYQTVALWFGGREPESYAIVSALAAILRVSPCHLAFGGEPDEWDVFSAELTDRPGPGGIDGIQVAPQKGDRGGKDSRGGKGDRPAKQQSPPRRHD